MRIPNLPHPETCAASRPTICGSCGYQGSGGGNARECARLEDVLDVLAYAALRYAELAGDLPVGQTGCDKLSS